MLLAVLFAAAARAAPSCSTLAVDPSRAVHVTAPYYASFNIDSSQDREFFQLDWAAPALASAASGLASAGSQQVIRFGGTGNNYLYYDIPGAGEKCVRSAVAPRRECLNSSTWAGVAAFAARARAPIVFGVNMFPAGARRTPPLTPLTQRPSLSSQSRAGTPSLAWSWRTSWALTAR